MRLDYLRDNTAVLTVYKSLNSKNSTTHKTNLLCDLHNNKKLDKQL